MALIDRSYTNLYWSAVVTYLHYFQVIWC